MAKFLHVADVHLGFDRYDNPQRTSDFFYAFQDVLRQYAIAEAVDFVLIAGDLFEHRNIQPSVLNQAQLCLRELKEAGIPVIAIEGNHDNRPYGARTSWLRYLADWDLLILLEPGDTSAGEPFYDHFNGRRGGYIDLDCGVRILGSNWYGASAPKAIEQIADAVASLPPFSGYRILLFHHGLEGQISRYQGALRYSDLLPLKNAGIDYLALGHIHKNYQVDNWIFNPGSIEANSIEESQYCRGAYLVNLHDSQIYADLKQDYCQRPITRLKLSTSGQETPEVLEQLLNQCVQKAIDSKEIVPEQLPIVELRVSGSVGFDRFELDIRRLQKELKELCGALIFLLKYEVDNVRYASPLSEEASQHQIEQDVFVDILTSNSSYKKHATHLANGLSDLKVNLQRGYADHQLYTQIEELIRQEKSSTGRS